VSEILRLRDAELEWRALEDEIVALDAAASQYLSVNKTGAVLWSALAKGATREELAAKLVETFDVDAATAARDLDAFLETLEAKNLLARA
jgi:hypothetical protein